MGCADTHGEVRRHSYGNGKAGGLRQFVGSLVIVLLVMGNLAVVSPAESAPRGHHGRHRAWGPQAASEGKQEVL